MASSRRSGGVKSAPWRKRHVSSSRTRADGRKDHEARLLCGRTTLSLLDVIRYVVRPVFERQRLYLGRTRLLFSSRGISSRRREGVLTFARMELSFELPSTVTPASCARVFGFLSPGSLRSHFQRARAITLCFRL